MILTEVFMNVVLLRDTPSPPSEISNNKMAETRKCEVGLTIAPRTFTSFEILGGCRA